MFSILAAALLAGSTVVTTAQQAAADAGFDATRLARVDTVVNDAIAARKLTGAVVLVGRGDTIVWRKAYGQRTIGPNAEPMSVDTIFDIASLTKAVATTTAVMMLVEEGRLRLTDPIASFVPGFERYGKGAITIRDALTHMSGLRAGLPQAGTWNGSNAAVARAIEDVPLGTPGRRFIYSDINFILLGEIVARVSGMPFERFLAERLFAPLGMRDTRFNPPTALHSRVAPTFPETRRGVVHDPTARRMGGVAGHAGLFSTADDLARFCRMLLGGGALGSTRILSPLTIARMTAPSTPENQAAVRGLGWDLDSPFSANRGDLLPLGSFGHTGATGTSIWIDPATRLFVVFLSSRVYPDNTGDVTPLRATVASTVAAALVDVPADDLRTLRWPRPHVAPEATRSPEPTSLPVLNGIDVLRANQFAPLRGLHVGLVTNHTGRARDGVTTIDLLHEAPDVSLVSLFSPEHGIRGVLDASVPSSIDETTRLPIHSLYGATRRPTAEMLNGIDAMVIDLQDIGARFYTYMTTMAYVMEEAAARNIKVFVLDRPNPIGGALVEGPALDASAVGFTGYLADMPIRPGLTMGELARLFNTERQIGVDLTVIAMRHWQRDAWYDETGLAWVNPSPNMRTMHAATLYPGVGAFEQTNISVGRGTDTPFEQIGAPWIDGVRLAEALNARRVPGIRFYPVTFSPTSSRFAGERCEGVFMVITDRQALRPVRVGVEIAAALLRLFPRQFAVGDAARLFGSAADLARLEAGDDPADIAASWSAAEARWRLLRAEYLLY